AEYAAKTIKEIYSKFENIQLFPEMGADLSKRVSFRTNYEYAVWENYVIIYKVGEEYVEIYRVVNRYRDITKLFE
ncbi:type II toxin-antitoxin system RelE/ParE family toxin, partial [Anaerostipes faecis]